MSTSLIKKMNTKLLTATLFTLLFFAPISNTGDLQKAEAQGFLVYDIQNTLTNTLQTISTMALEQKELVWDALFFEIAKKALQQMTNDIVQWVNSGFDGNPRFVTDLLGYLQEVSDQVAGDFIYGDELSTLCTPFQLDVRIALAEHYQEEEYGGFREQAECTLDEYGDTEAFLSGEFTAGGWGMWFEAVLNPLQTPIGAALGADAKRRELTLEKKAEEVKKLEFGDGFFSSEVCTPTEEGEDCTITTPGIVIKDQLSFALTVPARSLIEADEMNEVLGALFSNLAQQAVTGINGLLGLGGNADFADTTFGASGSLSYLDAMDAEAQEDWGSGGSTGNRIEQALVTETKVLELELAILTELDAISTAFEDAREPFEGDSCWNLTLPSQFTSKLNELVADVPTTINTIVDLEELVTAYESASSAQAQLAVLNQFTTLQSNGLISGQTAVIQYEYYLNNELRGMIEDFEEEISAEEESC